MSSEVISFLLILCIVLLSCVIGYQRFAFRKGTRAKLQEMSIQLNEILNTDGDQRVMVFTDDRALTELASQINRMLDDRQKVRADYRKAQISMKKMLSNISHDIKTPMTVILGYLEIMRIDGTPDGRMLQKVETTARRVMELITQFFTLAKLEAGDMDLTMSCLNVSEISRESVLGFYELLQEKEFQVEIGIPEQAMYASADRDALQRILSNLISNAVRYGSEGKYLGVFVREDQSQVCIDIVDRGRGIEKAFADSVFARLFTMEDSGNSAVQGNGLGLTIARDLALQMGGDLTLESVPHQKTVFTVSLKK